jgi:hypothetical protein
MINNNTKDEQVLVAGLSAGELVGMLKCDEAEFAAKALNYYDGKQEKEMVELLNHPEKGRKQWKKRGYIARHRNLTKMIVEKSAMLFKDAPPQLEVRLPGSDQPSVPATEAVVDLLDGTEWQETMANLDAVVRLLKTGLLLVQWDTAEGKPVFDILHRGNAAVVTNPLTKGVDVLVQRTGCSGKAHYYRIWSAETIWDVVELDQDVSLSATTPNTYGIVPVAVFYDTNAPRNGFWVDAPRDLVNVNEMYNLHLTDSEFAISWMKRPSLFTNCTLDGYTDEQIEVAEVYGSVLPRAVSRTPSLTAGPDIAVVVGSSGGDTPFIDYKSPQIDLKPMDDVVQGWVKQTAADWSVRVRADGEGKATSGFQVVVEEMPNLELRQLRQRMFEAGFKRFYRQLAAVSPIGLPVEAQLFAVFAKPNLPVDHKAEEDVWSVRIKEGRATELDYYMQTQGLSKDEAMAKWVEVCEFRQAKAKIDQLLAPEVEQDAQKDVQEEDKAENENPAE